MFIEVNSIEKGCPVMINLDEVLEIAPLMEHWPQKGKDEVPFHKMRG